jgi:hypothetical protein
MKTPYQVREKLKQATFYHRKKYLKQNLKKLPWNCTYNKEITLPNKKGEKVRICTYNNCYDPCYKQEHSECCNVFTPKRSEKDLKEDFNNLLKDKEYVNKNFKDLTALAWTLGSDIKGKPKLLVRIKNFFIKIIKSFLNHINPFKNKEH